MNNPLKHRGDTLFQSSDQQEGGREASIFAVSRDPGQGIATGSIWAAESWGRYGGWDPEGVWSLVAVLTYMAILHAKVSADAGSSTGASTPTWPPPQPDGRRPLRGKGVTTC